jgi:uncharacterized protein YbcI
VNTVTRDPIEEKLAETAAQYHADQQGRAPKSLSARMLPDMVVIYSAGIYTPIEENLCDTEEGRKLIKSARRELRSITRRDIESKIAAIVQCPVLRSFWDMDVRSGEQIEIYMLGTRTEPRNAVTEA